MGKRAALQSSHYLVKYRFGRVQRSEHLVQLDQQVFELLDVEWRGCYALGWPSVFSAGTPAAIGVWLQACVDGFVLDTLISS